MDCAASCHRHPQGRHMMFVRYLGIQLLSYGIDMGLFLVVLNSGLTGPITANVIAKLAAGTFAFLVHRAFTFRVTGQAGASRQAVLYCLLLALNMPLASVMLSVLLVWVSDEVVAKFLADVLCVSLTYAMSKHFIFAGGVDPVTQYHR
jgi:putative flippase GtrA